MDVRSVARFGLFSRALALALQAVFNALIPDHQPDAFSPPRASEPQLLDSVVEGLLGGLSRWDAEHFLFIAERGYLYEHNFAFFPLLPLSLRAVAGALLWPLAGWLSVRSRLLLAVALVNGLLGVLGAVALYGLGRVVTQDRRLAYYASLLFCLTPASVFMAAGYSESLFASLAFGGMWLLERGRTLSGCGVLALATAARSNGVVNVGFLLYLQLQQALGRAQLLRGTPWGVCRGLRYAGIAVCFLLKAALGSSAILLPFGLFQYYGYRTFCTPTIGPEQISPALLELAELKGYRIPDTTKAPPAWCQWPFPVLYSYIQDVYWDVGFLRYFQLKQLPNFLLALPVTVLGGTAAWQYFRADPWLCLQLGLLGEPLRKRGRAEGDRPAAGFRHPRVFVYVVHASVLLVFGGLWMHVQVLTRFLASSSPVLYWYCAHLLDKNEPWLRAPRDGGCEGECAAPGRPCVRCRTGAVWKGLPRNPLTRLLCHWGACSPVSRCVLGYFTSYWLLGLALHCNFLPWT